MKTDELPTTIYLNNDGEIVVLQYGEREDAEVCIIPPKLAKEMVLKYINNMLINNPKDIEVSNG